MELATLFADHLVERQKILEEVLEATGLETLVLSSGSTFTYFADDHLAPFWAHPHFAHWCPLAGPHHLLKLQPGRRPRLIRYAPVDFWFEQSPLGEPFWLQHFDLEEASEPDKVWGALGPCGRGAYVGDEGARARDARLEQAPTEMVARLDWARSYKTAYEVARLEEATESAARGHVAARERFHAGASELEIHHAFVTAAGVTDSELPYGSIVALDDKGAILHYENKRPFKPGKVLLIDAGTQCARYASDITRTYTTADCDERFVRLLEGMKRIQAGLCDAVRPGVPFLELHVKAHRDIGSLLHEAGLLRVRGDEALDAGLTRPFLPHGLGHHLGLQVHDVAGRQANPQGEPAPPPAEYPFLRNTRTIEPGQVFTIEPGLYFMPMLLEPFRSSAQAGAFDWETIDALTPCGGIRVEDNVLVTETGHRNLTREYLPD